LLGPISDTLNSTCTAICFSFRNSSRSFFTILNSFLQLVFVKFKGNSLNIFDLHGKTFPLIYSGDSANYTAGADPELAAWCFPGTLAPLITKGGVVMCDIPNALALVQGSAGVIMPVSIDESIPFPFPLSLISPEDYSQLLDYMRSTR
jgi:hypothetical protein